MIRFLSFDKNRFLSIWSILSPMNDINLHFIFCMIFCGKRTAPSYFQDFLRDIQFLNTSNLHFFTFALTTPLNFRVLLICSSVCLYSLFPVSHYLQERTYYKDLLYITSPIRGIEEFKERNRVLCSWFHTPVFGVRNLFLNSIFKRKERKKAFKVSQSFFKLVITFL